VDLVLADRLHLNLMRLNAWVARVCGEAVDWEDGLLLAASRSETAFLASAMGAPLYPRLGYEPVYDYRLLGWMPV
jgi:hypothetical protein